MLKEDNTGKGDLVATQSTFDSLVPGAAAFIPAVNKMNKSICEIKGMKLNQIIDSKPPLTSNTPARTQRGKNNRITKFIKQSIENIQSYR